MVSARSPACCFFLCLVPSRQPKGPRRRQTQEVDLMINYLGSENFLNIWLNVLRSAKRAGPALAGAKAREKFLLAREPGFPVGRRRGELMAGRRDVTKHSYVSCIACGRPFFAYRSRLLSSPGRFCSQRCFWQSWKAFCRALRSGQLDGILAMPVCQEVLDTDAPATRRRGAKWQL